MVHLNQFRKSMYLGLCAITLCSQIASAEVLDPNKEYSDARMSGTRAGNPTSIRQARQATPDTTMGWLESKVAVAKTAFSGMTRSLFGGAEKKQAASIAAAAAMKTVPNHAPVIAVPRGPASEGTVAKSAETATQETMSFPGLSKSDSGVVKYDLAPGIDAIPRLRLPKEERFSNSHFSLDGRAQKTLESKILAPLQSPNLMTSEELKRLARMPVAVLALKKLRAVAIQKGKIDDRILAKLVLKLSPETELKLAKFVPLTDDEVSFLKWPAALSARAPMRGRGRTLPLDFRQKRVAGRSRLLLGNVLETTWPDDRFFGSRSSRFRVGQRILFAPSFERS